MAVMKHHGCRLPLNPTGEEEREKHERKRVHVSVRTFASLRGHPHHNYCTLGATKFRRRQVYHGEALGASRYCCLGLQGDLPLACYVTVKANGHLCL